MKLQFMDLNGPLFLAGTNYGEKLPGLKGSNLVLEFGKWPETENEPMFKISDPRGFFTFVIPSAVKSWEPKQEKKLTVVNKHHDQAAGVATKAQIGGPNDVFKAQVETPQDKVQGKPGRKPKYQGEEVQGE